METVPLFLFCLPLLADLAPMGMVAALILASLGVAYASARAQLGRPDARKLLPWAPLLVLLPLSAAWSLAPRASLALAAELLVLFASGTVLASQLPPMAARYPSWLRALGWGLCVAGVLTLSEACDHAWLAHLIRKPQPFTGYMVGYSRGASVIGMLIVPVAVGLYRTGARRLALGQLLLGAAALLAGYQLAAKVALGLGLVAATLVFAAPRLRWALLALPLLAAAAPPLLLPYPPSRATICDLAIHKPSALHRLLIWNFVGRAIDRKPLLGWGLDAARRMPGGGDPIMIQPCGMPPGTPSYVLGQQLPLHPHNAAIQIWLELGAAGVAAAVLGLMLNLIRALRAADRWRDAGLAALVVTAGTSCEMSYGIWQQWWIASLFLAAAIAAAALATPPRAIGSPRAAATPAPRPGAA